MYDITKTIYGAARDTALSMGIDIVRLPNTTLNEAYDTSVSTVNETGALEWYTIGVKYDSLIESGELNISEVRHLPTDANLFLPLPFFAKPISEELTELEKSIYGMFTRKTINGVIYNCPYLKKITDKDDLVDIYDITYGDGKYSAKRFNSIDADVLNPKPTAGLDTYPEIMGHVGLNAKVRIGLTVDEVNNIKLAADLIYPLMAENDRHTISELGLVSGIGDVPIGAQIDYFVKIDKPLCQWNEQKNMLSVLYLGGMMPRVKNRKI